MNASAPAAYSPACGSEYERLCRARRVADSDLPHQCTNHLFGADRYCVCRSGLMLAPMPRQGMRPSAATKSVGETGAERHGVIQPREAARAVDEGPSRET